MNKDSKLPYILTFVIGPLIFFGLLVGSYFIEKAGNKNLEPLFYISLLLLPIYFIFLFRPLAQNSKQLFKVNAGRIGGMPIPITWTGYLIYLVFIAGLIVAVALFSRSPLLSLLLIGIFTGIFHYIARTNMYHPLGAPTKRKTLLLTLISLVIWLLLVLELRGKTM